MTYTDKYKQIWYYKLKKLENETYKVLFDYHSRTSIVTTGKMLIQLVDTRGNYLFTLFNNHVEFYTYQLKISAENRCYFETILGETPQKLYFDVDIDLIKYPHIDHEDVKNSLIKAILLTLEDFQISYQIQRDILVC